MKLGDRRELDACAALSETRQADIRNVKRIVTLVIAGPISETKELELRRPAGPAGCVRDKNHEHVGFIQVRSRHKGSDCKA
jgi:hypothetical protein